MTYTFSQKVQFKIRAVRDPMTHRRGNRLTIFQTMGFVAVAGGILGLVAAVWDEPVLIAVVLIAGFVIIVPAHLAIEANRCDALKARLGEAGDDDEAVRSPELRR